MLFYNTSDTENKEPLFTELGHCPGCYKSVYKNQLYVEEQLQVYHFSCYNRLKQADEGEI